MSFEPLRLFHYVFPCMWRCLRSTAEHMQLVFGDFFGADGTDGLGDQHIMTQ